MYKQLVDFLHIAHDRQVLHYFIIQFPIRKTTVFTFTGYKGAAVAPLFFL